MSRDNYKIWFSEISHIESDFKEAATEHESWVNEKSVKNGTRWDRNSRNDGVKVSHLTPIGTEQLFYRVAHVCSLLSFA